MLDTWFGGEREGCGEKSKRRKTKKEKRKEKTNRLKKKNNEREIWERKTTHETNNSGKTDKEKRLPFLCAVDRLQLFLAS
jgi:hypothetical protein